MTINELMRALIAELAEGGIPEPLSTPFTLAALWDDLSRLAGEEPPPAALALLDDRPSERTAD